MPGRRVIVHAGFHKTGTTSAQHFLFSNGNNIWPRCALVLPGRLRKGAARMAVRYSRFGTAALLDEFARDLRDVLAAIDAGKRNVLISDENLSGRMPGRDGQMGYAATPALMARAEGVICDVFGTESDVVFHFNTRQPDAWLRSTYKHNLRTSRLTMDEQTYITTYADAAAFGDVTDAVDDAVTGTVYSADLADLTGLAGPAEPLIDLINLPPHLYNNLEPFEAQNTGPDDGLIAQLLDLNRSSLADQDLQKAKTDLIEKANTHER